MITGGERIVWLVTLLNIGQRIFNQLPFIRCSFLEVFGTTDVIDKPTKRTAFSLDVLGLRQVDDLFRLDICFSRAFAHLDFLKAFLHVRRHATFKPFGCGFDFTLDVAVAFRITTAILSTHVDYMLGQCEVYFLKFGHGVDPCRLIFLSLVKITPHIVEELLIRCGLMRGALRSFDFFF